MIKMFGTTWCGDCKRAKAVLDEMGEAFEWIDVDRDETSRAHVVSVIGKVKVPLIEFADGSHLVEPSNQALKEKVNALRVSPAH